MGIPVDLDGKVEAKEETVSGSSVPQFSSSIALHIFWAAGSSSPAKIQFMYLCSHTKNGIVEMYSWSAGDEELDVQVHS